MCEGLNTNQKLMCNIMCFTATVSDLYNLLLLFIQLIFSHGAKAYEVQAKICWCGAM